MMSYRQRETELLATVGVYAQRFGRISDEELAKTGLGPDDLEAIAKGDEQLPAGISEVDLVLLVSGGDINLRNALTKGVLGLVGFEYRTPSQPGVISVEFHDPLTGKMWGRWSRISKP